MTSPRDRLRLAPDVHSDTSGTDDADGRSPEMGEAPLKSLVLVAPEERGRGRQQLRGSAGLRRYATKTKGSTDVRQSSRPPVRVTSGPQRIAVKITPAKDAGHTTTTPASA